MKESFSTHRHYLNQKQCMEVMLEHGIVPVVNENDTVSVTELMFTDNDELSGLVATMMGVDVLLILSNVDGVYDGDPALPTSALLREVVPDARLDTDSIVQTSRSSLGRGGMITKFRMAQKVASEGITVIIANGKREHILTDILLERNEVPYTRFLPGSHPVSGVKKWIAHSEGFAKGKIQINEGAYRALLSSQAASLLPVGVVAVEGQFEKMILCRYLLLTARHLLWVKSAVVQRRYSPAWDYRANVPLFIIIIFTLSGGQNDGADFKRPVEGSTQSFTCVKPCV